MEQNVINPDLSLKENIDNRIKLAMKAQDKPLLTVLRAIKKAIVDEEKAEGKEDREGTVLPEAETTKILKKLVKQREDSATLYTDNKRPELAAVEIYEAGIIKEYAPQQLSEALTRELIVKLITDGAKEIGTIMKYIQMNDIQVNGKLASQIAAELLPKPEKKEKVK